MDRAYHGTRNHRSGQRAAVTYTIETLAAGDSIEIETRGVLEPEAPAHFGWGRDIGGANHLAYALLRHATGSEEIAREHHTLFAKDVVVHWGSDWTITLDEIVNWLEASGCNVENGGAA